MKSVIATLMLLLICVSSSLCAQGLESTQPAAGATRITEYQLPPEKLQKSEALYHARIVMLIANTLYGIALLALVLWLRVGAKFRDWAELVSQRRFVQALIFVPLLLLLIDVGSLPLSMYGHDLQVRYGLSVQSWGSWFWDWTKGEIIGTIIATLLLWGLYAILRRRPKYWWFYGWLASIPVILLMVFVQPVFIAPLFNKFESLEARQPQLLPEIEKVMHRGGLQIERSRMFEMQASDKVTTYNAYVTGIGASKRVVVWDNTSKDLTVPETLFVFGHEQGHYVLHHIWQALAFAIVGLLLALYLAHRLIGVVLARLGRRIGVRDVGDWVSLPVLLLMAGVFSMVAQPVDAAFSRYHEHQADIYALEVLHGLVPDSSQAATHAFQKLGEKGLAYPQPNAFYVWWAFSHPPIADRIRFAAAYQPWNNGQPTRFVPARGDAGAR